MTAEEHPVEELLRSLAVRIEDLELRSRSGTEKAWLRTLIDSERRKDRKAYIENVSRYGLPLMLAAYRNGIGYDLLAVQMEKVTPLQGGEGYNKVLDVTAARLRREQDARLNNIVAPVTSGWL